MFSLLRVAMVMVSLHVNRILTKTEIIRVLQNKTTLAKQAAAGRLLEPGVRAQPSQFNQFLLQETETNSLKRQRWQGHVSTVFPDQPGQKCGAVSKQQKKNKMKEQARR